MFKINPYTEILTMASNQLTELRKGWGNISPTPSLQTNTHTNLVENNQIVFEMLSMIIYLLYNNNSVYKNLQKVHGKQ